MKRILLTTLALFGASALTASAGPITIDKFTDLLPAETHYNTVPPEIQNALEVGSVRLNSGPTTWRSSETASQTGLAGVLGGQRDSTLTHVSGTGGGYMAYIGDGYLSSMTGSGIPWRMTTTLLQYGNVTALNADFSALAGGYFLLKDWMLDSGTVNATLTLTSGTTTQSKVVSLPAGVGGNAIDVMIGFSEFGLINFSDVDVIKLQFANTIGGQDWDMGGFSAEGTGVPDGGATLMLLGCALTGLGALRRKLGA